TGPYLTLTMGYYSLMHEPLHQFGTLQLDAGMLHAEQSRPIETGLGRRIGPEASVRLDSDVTVVAIRGDVASLTAAWASTMMPLSISSPRVSASCVFG